MSAEAWAGVFGPLTLSKKKVMLVQGSQHLSREQSIPLQGRNQLTHPPSAQDCKGNFCAAHMSPVLKCQGCLEYIRRLDIPVQDIMFMD